MSPLVLGLALAVVASVALNGSYLIQHAGSVTAPAISARRPVRTLRGLFASRLWVAGAALGMTGWGLHVVALSRAPLSLVQAFVAGGLALVAPVARRTLGQRLEPREQAAVAAMALALLALAAGLRDPGARGAFDGGGLAAYLAGACVLAAALAAVPAARTRTHAHLLGLAGGAFYGSADVAIKAVTHTGLRSPWLLAALAATVAAFFCFQRGLQTGRAVPVIALMTAGTNVVSIAGGLIVFGDPLGRTPALAALHAASFVLVLAAAAALAPGAGGEPGYSSPQPVKKPEFNAMVHGVDTHWWYRGRRRIVASELERLRLRPGCDVLDAGCGAGQTLDDLARLGTVHGVHGVDMSPDAVRASRARGHLNVEVSGIERLPHPDAAFDLVTCLDVVEHTPDDVATFTELLRVTRPGGHLLVTVPAYQLLWSSHDVANQHYRRYRLSTLAAAAAEAGWRLERRTYFNSFLLPPAALVRLVRRSRAKAEEHSDLNLTPAWLNPLLELPLRVEAALIRAGLRLPAGLSLLAVFGKPAPLGHDADDHGPLARPVVEVE